jgi:hypothetical protein
LERWLSEYGFLKTRGSYNKLNQKSKKVNPIDESIYALIFVSAKDQSRYLAATVNSIQLELGNSLLKSNLYKKAQSASGKIIWATISYKKTDSAGSVGKSDESKIITAQQIKDLYSGEALGTFLILIDEENCEVFGLMKTVRIDF